MKKVLNENVVLAIDLDGTLTPVDTLYELVLKLFFSNPILVLLFPFWLFYGKAFFKLQISRRVEFCPKNIPYNTSLIVWIREQKKEGREIALCTGSDELVANAVAEHLGFFDYVLASDGCINNVGRNKKSLLDTNFGIKGYDYVGNSSDDIDVWTGSRSGILVATSKRVTARAIKNCNIIKQFDAQSTTFSSWKNFFRIEQWTKNLLLFLPIIALHDFTNLSSLIALIWAFFAFSLCASAGYIFNDLVDLESDRSHPSKYQRPLAAGIVSTKFALILLIFLLLLGGLIASAIGFSFQCGLALYVVSSTLYSSVFKRYVLLDCVVLAGLYTLRIICGGIVADITPSFWLLAFSSFMFLSLALEKRYAEINLHILEGKSELSGRGYILKDAPIVAVMGIVAGYSSVLLLSLYLNSEVVKSLYNKPNLIWLGVPILLFWISRLWLKAHRGEIYEDPIVFTLRDKGSLTLISLLAVVFILALL